MKARAGLLAATLSLPTLLGIGVAASAPAYAVGACDPAQGQECAVAPSPTTQPSQPAEPLPTQAPSTQAPAPAPSQSAAPTPTPSSTPTSSPSSTPDPTASHGTAEPVPVENNVGGGVDSQPSSNGSEFVPIIPDQGYVDQGAGSNAVPVTPIVPVPDVTIATDGDFGAGEASEDIVVEQATTSNVEKDWPLIIGVCLGALAFAVALVTYTWKKYGAPFSKQ